MSAEKANRPGRENLHEKVFANMHTILDRTAIVSITNDPWHDHVGVAENAIARTPEGRLLKILRGVEHHGILPPLSMSTVRERDIQTGVGISSITPIVIGSNPHFNRVTTVINPRLSYSQEQEIDFLRDAALAEVDIPTTLEAFHQLNQRRGPIARIVFLRGLDNI